MIMYESSRVERESTYVAWRTFAYLRISLVSVLKDILVTIQSIPHGTQYFNVLFSMLPIIPSLTPSRTQVSYSHSLAIGICVLLLYVYMHIIWQLYSVMRQPEHQFLRFHPTASNRRSWSGPVSGIQFYLSHNILFSPTFHPILQGSKSNPGG